MLKRCQCESQKTRKRNSFLNFCLEMLNPLSLWFLLFCSFFISLYQRIFTSFVCDCVCDCDFRSEENDDIQVEYWRLWTASSGVFSWKLSTQNHLTCQTPRWQYLQFHGSNWRNFTHLDKELCEGLFIFDDQKKQRLLSKTLQTELNSLSILTILENTNWKVTTSKWPSLSKRKILLSFSFVLSVKVGI
jgi:hypothetical protein